jgi:DNA-binding NtrC family response regulator
MSMQTATVLVIDDLADVRALLAEVLGFYGYAVVTAASVPEAEAVRQHLGWEGLDLVITDLRLTLRADAREGADLIQRWQALRPQLPCIVMGGDLRREDVLTTLSLRGVWSLTKPFTMAAFLATIQAALRYAPEALALSAPQPPKGWGTRSSLLNASDGFPV